MATSAYAYVLFRHGANAANQERKNEKVIALVYSAPIFKSPSLRQKVAFRAAERAEETVYSNQWLELRPLSQVRDWGEKYYPLPEIAFSSL